MQKISKKWLCLLFALSVGTSHTMAAGQSAHQDFMSAVNKGFIANTLVGSWVSDCVYSKDASSTFVLVYRFDDEANLNVDKYSYMDSGCEYLKQSATTEGSVQLVGLHINTKGLLVHELELADSDSNTQELLVSFDQEEMFVTQEDTFFSRVRLHRTM